MDGYSTKLCLSSLSFVVAIEMRDLYVHKVVQHSFCLGKDNRKSFNKELKEITSLKVSAVNRARFLSAMRSLRDNYDVSDELSHYIEELIYWHYTAVDNREYIISRVERIRKERPNIDLRLQLIDYIIKSYNNHVWVMKQVDVKVLFSYETAIKRLRQKSVITETQYSELMDMVSNYLSIQYYSPSLQIK